MSDRKKKSLVLFVYASRNDKSGNTTSDPLAMVAREENGNGWCWEDLRSMTAQHKPGFASYEEALADVLSYLGLSSGESADEYEDDYGPRAKLR